MSAQTGMTSKEKLQTLHRLSALSGSAEDIIQKGTRSPGGVLLLLEALQAFKDDTLGAIVRIPRRDLFFEEISMRCNLEIRDVPFSPDDQRYLKRRGLRYVGEIFYVWFDPRSIHARKTEERIKEVLTSRLSLVGDLDPIALGWKPFYWSDTTYTDEFNVLILERHPTSPEVPNWDRFVRLQSYERSRRGMEHPHFRGIARRLHLRGIHFFGEEFVQERNDHCPSGKRSTGSMEELQIHLRGSGSRLWAGFLVPPNWVFPNWRGDLWEAELLQIEKEMGDLAEARGRWHIKCQE